MARNLVNKRVFRFPLWLSLLILSGGIAAWFSVLALIGAYTYLKLDARAPARVSSLQVEEQGPSRYLVQAEYSYGVKGKIYEGRTLFCEPVYLNRISADADLDKWRQFSWEAWYNSNDPQDSSLQKFFPFKKFLYALLTIGVFVYFLILRYFTFSRSIWKNDL